MTKIEWCRGDDGIEGKTWNPVTGCTKVSAGCKHCYAETVAERFWAKQYPPITPKRAPEDDFDVASVDGFAGIRDFDRPRRRRFTDVQCHADRLEEPLHWRKARRVFVNSMSDLFHEAVPDEFIDRVFAVMALCPQHTFQVLTKRPERMRSYVAGMLPDLAERLGRAAPLVDFHTQDGWADITAQEFFETDADARKLRNVWLGVSAENQETADARIPILLDTPAAVRFVSAEPLLGPIDFEHLPLPGGQWWDSLSGLRYWGPGAAPIGQRLDWIIIGGESGAGARPCDVAWIRSIVEQCKAAGTACFVKQLGSFSTHAVEVGHFTGRDERPGAHRNRHVASNGGDPSEWPVDLCVREFPEVRT